MTRVAIVGSRCRTDIGAVMLAVLRLPAGDVVVSGGARGVDSWAAAFARAFGRELVEHLPDLSGVRSRFDATKRFYARNQAIVDDCDRVIAFPAPDRKGGTEDTIRRAIKAGKPVDLR